MYVHTSRTSKHAGRPRLADFGYRRVPMRSMTKKSGNAAGGLRRCQMARPAHKSRMVSFIPPASPSRSDKGVDKHHIAAISVDVCSREYTDTRLP
ncbi:hypothetical protein EVAR_95390_1 [Eumeta japonica]|uniref:Uncharacterized protein n=1 Tax=Eumeta variegata TaxID=151549 RepID=A0A4C1VIT0_EUMVA|nr:hypothetical protein EVAR_95390_1 [Eumeta japonica]